VNGIEPTAANIPGYNCPSNVTSTFNRGGNPARGVNNYFFNMGDSLSGNDANASSTTDLRSNQNTCRGLFTFHVTFTLTDIIDGTSNTIAMAEALKASDAGQLGDHVRRSSGNFASPQECLNTFDNATGLYKNPLPANVQVMSDTLPGFRYADGDPLYSGFNTILPPNNASCINGTGNGGVGFYTASSNHRGGAQVVMADGAVKFITENIDTGNLTAAQITNGNGRKSPYGVWGAMGTKHGTESVTIP
jgi:prepilin-type processing-associated H-X9-DG protein